MMKKILVISGKGGTGKTFLTASLSSLPGEKRVMVDCDVDAANLYLLLNPEIKKTEVFMGGNEASVKQEECIQCGVCLNICRFDAISVIKNGRNGTESFAIDPLSCEGCGACGYVCPVDAIKMEEKENGRWFVSDTRYGPFVFAKLGIAAENSGKLVTKIKEEAEKIAEAEKADYIIIDGPPGIGCPVIASISGVDLALIVTEPSLSGISDMQRVMKVTEHFQVETMVVINKYDINPENSKKIEEECLNKGIEIAGYIPFSKKVPESIVQAVPYVEFSKDGITEQIKEIWNRIS
jgi:MinD superfamily P-loop ATPase